VERGWLGIEAQDITPQLAESFELNDTHGMLIAGVLRDGPADLATIKPGDIIERINGKDVDNARSAMAFIAQLGPDAELVIEGKRDNQPFTLKAMTGRRPDVEPK